LEAVKRGGETELPAIVIAAAIKEFWFRRWLGRISRVRGCRQGSGYNWCSKRVRRIWHRLRKRVGGGQGIDRRGLCGRCGREIRSGIARVHHRGLGVSLRLRNAHTPKQQQCGYKVPLHDAPLRGLAPRFDQPPCYGKQEQGLLSMPFRGKGTKEKRRYLLFGRWLRKLRVVNGRGAGSCRSC